MPARHLRSRAGLTTAAGILALGALAACGSSGGSDAATPAAGATSTSGSTSTASPPAGASIKKIDVTLAGSKVTPAPSKVKVPKGTYVELTVTRDTDGDIHIHGYDIEEPAKAGVPLTISFLADQEGVFEIEAHDPDRQLLQLQVG